MKSDVIVISSEGNNMDAVLAQIEKVCAYKQLSPKNSMHRRLLAEETMAMMRAITGSVNGEFWVEDRDGVYEMHLRVTTLIDDTIRSQLLTASTSGKNEATRSFMGKIRSFFEPSNGVPMFTVGFAGGAAPQMYGSYSWSMEDYRDQLRQYQEMQHKADQEAWILDLLDYAEACYEMAYAWAAEAEYTMMEAAYEIDYYVEKFGEKKE